MVLASTGRGGEESESAAAGLAPWFWDGVEAPADDAGGMNVARTGSIKALI
jgi:hypothetical protein